MVHVGNYRGMLLTMVEISAADDLVFRTAEELLKQTVSAEDESQLVCEMTDEYVASVSDFEDCQSFLEAVRAQIEAENLSEMQRFLGLQIEDGLVRITEIDDCENLVAAEFDNLFGEETVDKGSEELFEAFRKEFIVKKAVLSIAEAEGIVVSDEEVDAELVKSVLGGGLCNDDLEKLRLDCGYRAEVAYSLVKAKVFDLILSCSSLSRDLVFENLAVEYREVISDGNEIAERLEKAREHYGVTDNEALAEKMRAYEDAEHMIRELKRSLVEYIDTLNTEVRRRAVIDALIAANGAFCSDIEVEGYVDEVVAILKAQAGDEVFRQTLGASDEAMATLRASIKKSEGHVPIVRPLLDEIAFSLGMIATDQERLFEIESQRDYLMDKSAMRDASAILEKVKKDSAALAALDRKVLRNMALDYVMGSANCRVVGTVLLSDVTPGEFGLHF